MLEVVGADVGVASREAPRRVSADQGYSPPPQCYISLVPIWGMRPPLLEIKHFIPPFSK